jgi:hypothetical protein
MVHLGPVWRHRWREGACSLFLAVPWTGMRAVFCERGLVMILPAEKELRAALARFAEARIEHDVFPTGRTSRALEDSTYTLCVMTGVRTCEQALRAADALLQRYRADRKSPTQDNETLAA